MTIARQFEAVVTIRSKPEYTSSDLALSACNDRNQNI